MLGSPGPDFKNPKVSGQATQNLYVDVDDVDQHYARATKAGAKSSRQPQDTSYGARRYGAEDPEGHLWYFAQELTSQAATARRKPRAKIRCRQESRTCGGKKRSSRK